MEEIAEAAAAMRHLFPSSMEPGQAAEPSGAMETLKLAIDRAQSLSSGVIHFGAHFLMLSNHTIAGCQLAWLRPADECCN